MGWKARVAIAAVFVGLFVLGNVYLQMQGKLDSEITGKYLLSVIFGLFVTSIGIDLIAKAVHEILADKEKNAILQRIDAIPGMMALHADMVVFRDRNAGYQHCVEACGRAKSVRNNILRYGETMSADEGDSPYKDWRDAKASSIQSLGTVWKEIVSAHLDETDPQVDFSKRMSQLGARYYAWRRLNDRQCPMVQMTLFEYETYSEVLFGWEFPGNWLGPSLLTRNPEAVKFFERYFDHHFEIGLAP